MRNKLLGLIIVIITLCGCTNRYLFTGNMVCPIPSDSITYVTKYWLDGPYLDEQQFFNIELYPACCLINKGDSLIGFDATSDGKNLKADLLLFVPEEIVENWSDSSLAFPCPNMRVISADRLNGDTFGLLLKDNNLRNTHSLKMVYWKIKVQNKTLKLLQEQIFWIDDYNLNEVSTQNNFYRCGGLNMDFPFDIESSPGNKLHHENASLISRKGKLELEPGKAIENYNADDSSSVYREGNTIVRVCYKDGYRNEIQIPIYFEDFTIGPIRAAGIYLNVRGGKGRNSLVFYFYEFGERKLHRLNKRKYPYFYEFPFDFIVL